MPKYSVIVPVYNRPDELKELLESIVAQGHPSVEVVVVEDGSTVKSDEVVATYSGKLKIDYLYKENTGPGDTRNHGMKHAKGEWLLIFDSDAILPPSYFAQLDDYLSKHEIDAFGGPDSGHQSFSSVQRAISQSMTSTFTTGGIRGKKKSLEKFNPRSFNMGLKKEVFQKTGGFPDVMLAEDTDLAIRMHKAGYKVVLVPECFVYHKRRVSFKKFFRQVRNFGYGRAVLTKKYPDTFKPFFLFPSAFLAYSVLSVPHAIYHQSMFVLWPLALFIGLVFFEALLKEKNLLVAFLTVPAAFVQLFGYGWGFVKGFWEVFITKNSKYLLGGTEALKKAQ